MLHLYIHTGKKFFHFLKIVHADHVIYYFWQPNVIRPLLVFFKLRNDSEWLARCSQSVYFLEAACVLANQITPIQRTQGQY